jgi:hypothetical protein
MMDNYSTLFNMAEIKEIKFLINWYKIVQAVLTQETTHDNDTMRNSPGYNPNPNWGSSSIEHRTSNHPNLHGEDGIRKMRNTDQRLKLETSYS